MADQRPDVNYKGFIVTGVIIIICGVLSSITGAIQIGTCNPLGYGIYIGLVFITTGIMCMTACRYKNTIFAVMTMSIFTSVISVVMIGLSAYYIYIVEVHGLFKRYWGHALDVNLIGMSVLALVTSIVSSVLCRKALGCGRPRSEPMAQGRKGPTWVLVMGFVIFASGVFSVIIGIIQLYNLHSWYEWYFVGYGIWAGAIIMVTGVIGFTTWRYAEHLMALMIPCVLTSVVAFAMAVRSFVTIVWARNGSGASTSVNLLVIALIVLITSNVCSAFCCKAVGCGRRRRPGTVFELISGSSVSGQQLRVFVAGQTQEMIASEQFSEEHQVGASSKDEIGLLFQSKENR